MNSFHNDRNDTMMRAMNDEDEDIVDIDDTMSTDDEHDSRDTKRDSTRKILSTSALLQFKEQVEEMAKRLEDNDLLQSSTSSSSNASNNGEFDTQKYKKSDFLNDMVFKNMTTETALPTTQPYVYIGLLQQIDQINSQIQYHLQRQLSASEAETVKQANEATEERFREYYMSTLTDTFGDDLDQLRQQEGLDEDRLAVLIDALESGQDTYTLLDKQLTVQY
ncbi:hypothetical protein BDF19DRAFT_433236 [Syncephalis fuscata]|nr:hypothetical protein BDF19DRAFT_433236 [Syncephalis fuscata]